MIVFCKPNITVILSLFYSSVQYFYTGFVKLCLQSVLIIIDRHEWYVPPQLYVRDDSIGLWVARPAIPADTSLFSSTIDWGRISTAPMETPVIGERRLEADHQNNNENWEDRCSRMQTDDENIVDDSIAGDGSFGGKKRRQIEEDSIVEGRAFSNGASDDFKDQNLEHQPNSENSEVLHHQVAVRTNASIAEQVIEPTLVMFEVGKSFQFLSGFMKIIVVWLSD